MSAAAFVEATARRGELDLDLTENFLQVVIIVTSCLVVLLCTVQLSKSFAYHLWSAIGAHDLYTGFV